MPFSYSQDWFLRSIKEKKYIYIKECVAEKEEKKMVSLMAIKENTVGLKNESTTTKPHIVS